MNTDRIEKKVVLRAPRSRVWRAIANAKEFGEWFRVKLDGKFQQGIPIYGKITHPVNNSLSDLSGFEKIAIWPCAAAALVMGVAPIMWLGALDPAVKATLAPFAQVASRVVGQ